MHLELVLGLLDDVQGKIFPLEMRGDDGHVILCCRMTWCPCQLASQLLFKDPHACVTIGLLFLFKIFKLGVNLATGI